MTDRLKQDTDYYARGQHGDVTLGCETPDEAREHADFLMRMGNFRGPYVIVKRYVYEEVVK